MALLFTWISLLFRTYENGQVIEIPLVFGLEFGDLDPYFFITFIKSTPEYQPLPIDIYVNYADGLRIIEKMVSLGKFERISSNIENYFGTVVSDRDKVEINIYKGKSILTGKQGFSLWKFLGFG